MDAKQAIDLTMQTGKTEKRIKKVIRYVEKKILKGIKKGKWWIVIDHKPVRPTFNPFRLLTKTERQLIIDYFEELDFTITELSLDRHEYSWKPRNFEQRFKPCTEDSKLKHVVMTGEEPKVII